MQMMAMDSSDSDDDYCAKITVPPPAFQVSKDNSHKFALSRFEFFKSQNVDHGYFDVSFEIKGKILHANKFILGTVSEPLKTMMSPPWSVEGKTVKIEGCSYEAFYEFLCFLYSSDCNISNANVIELTDLAECYAVPAFQEYCDTYLSKMALETEEFYNMVLFADKYSLPSFNKTLEKIFCQQFKKLISEETFLNLEKPIVARLSTYRTRNRKHTELYFISVYKWAEAKAITKLLSKTKEEFDPHKFIKKELIDIIPLIDYDYMSLPFVVKTILPKAYLFSFDLLLDVLGRCDPVNDKQAETLAKKAVDLAETQLMSTETEASDIRNSMNRFFYSLSHHQLSFDFVTKFIVDKPYLFSNVICELIAKCKRRDDQEEKLFVKAYNLAEKSVLEKQKAFPTPNFRVLAAVKQELQPFLRSCKFWNLSKKFVEGFVVAKSILTEDEGHKIWNVKVTIKEGFSEVLLTGTMQDHFGLCARIQEIPVSAPENSTKLCFTHPKKFYIPKTQSIVKKVKGCDWYLCFEKGGTLAIKHQSLCKRAEEYLLAELRSSNRNLKLNTSHHVKIMAEREFKYQFNIFEENRD